ncbi:MAG: hypothetical protein O2861_07830 [Proteobacteria bacterium]|nr:hypothetical protein [Pseudomonadota bacterium]
MLLTKAADGVAGGISQLIDYIEYIFLALSLRSNGYCRGNGDACELVCQALADTAGSGATATNPRVRRDKKQPRPVLELMAANSLS